MSAVIYLSLTIALKGTCAPETIDMWPRLSVVLQDDSIGQVPYFKDWTDWLAGVDNRKHVQCPSLASLWITEQRAHGGLASSVICRWMACPLIGGALAMTEPKAYAHDY